jgi:hypothetical protein
VKIKKELSFDQERETGSGSDTGAWHKRLFFLTSLSLRSRLRAAPPLLFQYSSHPFYVQLVPGTGRLVGPGGNTPDCCQTMSRRINLGSSEKLDIGGEVKSGAHLELEFVGCRTGKSTSPLISTMRETPHHVARFDPQVPHLMGLKKDVLSKYA